MLPAERRALWNWSKIWVKGREKICQMVIKHPSDPAGMEALGIVLGGEGQKALTTILQGEDGKAVAVSKALGSSNNQSYWITCLW